MLGVRACDQAEAFEHRTEQPVSCRFGKPAEHSTGGYFTIMQMFNAGNDGYYTFFESELALLVAFQGESIWKGGGGGGGDS